MLEPKLENPVPRNLDEARRDVAKSVARWRAVGRATLLLVLGYSAVQYYFFSVFVEILSLPGITVFAALATAG